MVSQQALDGVLEWVRRKFHPARVNATADTGGRGFLFRVELGAPSPTLRICERVLVHHTVPEILAALERHHVAARLRSDPIRQLRCLEEAGQITIVQRQSWRRPEIWRPGSSWTLRYLPPGPLRLAADVLAALPDAVVVTGLDRRILTANGAAAQLFGRRLEDLPGTPIDELINNGRGHLEADDRSAGGQAQRFETTVAQANREERQVAVVMCPLVRDGQRIGMVTTLRDVTRKNKYQSGTLAPTLEFRYDSLSGSAWLRSGGRLRAGRLPQRPRHARRLGARLERDPYRG